MHTKLITTTEEFLSLKNEWERLQKDDPDVTYYSTYEFIKAWWEVYSDTKNNSLFILCVYSDKEIVAIAPLMLETERKMLITYKVLKFLGRGDYFNFILNRKNGLEIISIKNIFNEILSSNKWDKLRLTHINSNSWLAYFFLRNNQYNRYFHNLIECPVVILKSYESFEEYKSNYHIHKEIKREINQLKTNIDYKLKVVKNNEFDVYEKISQLHRKEQNYLVKVKGRNKSKSLFNNSRYSKFVQKIYKNNENVITFILEDNSSNILSYNTCYRYNGILSIWNTAYNFEYHKYSLNKVLDYETIKYVFENKFAEVIDLGAGRYDWKFKWTKNFIADYQFVFGNTNTPKGRFFKLVLDFKNKLRGYLN